jgi:hypothetical protein
MTPWDFFGYQISDRGRLVLPGLTPEETLEYEMLSRRRSEHRDCLRAGLKKKLSDFSQL